jgi:hypothetical protein
MVRTLVVVVVAADVGNADVGQNGEVAVVVDVAMVHDIDDHVEENECLHDWT